VFTAVCSDKRDTSNIFTVPNLALSAVSDNLVFFKRTAMGLNENRIAKEEATRRALPYVPDDFKTVFLDSSSTALLLVQKLPLEHKTVVTNNLQSALLLSKIDGVDIVIPGGNLYSSSSSVKGAWTNSLLREFRFDLMICSCACISDGGAYESALDQREIKRIAYERSAFHILLADQSKINGQGAYFVAPLSGYEVVALGGDGDFDKEAIRGAKLV
jgi:DeoR/GlpR family transcriptional regulator of sugar metabolism